MIMGGLHYPLLVNRRKIFERNIVFMLIINANIITMDSVDFENGYILIENGKIIDLGNMTKLNNPTGEVFDVNGATVLPGFIDSHCHIGILEDALGFEGDDVNEHCDPITPNLRAIDAVNPRDRCFKEALAAGVTTVISGPGSANPIGGRWIAMKTYGNRIDNMILKNPVGIKFALGENPKTVYSKKHTSPVTRMSTVALIREQLYKAKKYMDNLNQFEQDPDCDEPEYDAKSEALIPLLKGDLKAFIHAHRADDIFTAIRLANEFKLKYVLVHATESHLIADELSNEKASIIAGPFLCDRSKPELKELTPENPAILSNNNIKFAICTDHPVIPIQYLGLCAGVAIKHGLDRIKALEAITISSATICGIDNRVGSITPGKDADILVFNDDPFSVYSSPSNVIINGYLVK